MSKFQIDILAWVSFGFVWYFIYVSASPLATLVILGTSITLFVGAEIMERLDHITKILSTPTKIEVNVHAEDNPNISHLVSHPRPVDPDREIPRRR